MKLFLNKQSWLRPDERRVIFLASLGGALEFYDFVVFLFVAPIVAREFFPSSDPVVSLLYTLLIFAITYFTRPLGGIIFGHLGDTKGRKLTFLYTIFFMVVPTLLLGLLPTYAQVGISAPIALAFLRFMQGLAVGGEIPGAMVYVGEYVPKTSQGIACALIFFGLNTGNLLGNFTVALLQHSLSSEQFSNFGWRIPFLIGGIAGGIIFYLRQRLAEPAEFAEILKNARMVKHPIRLVWQDHRVKVLLGVGMMALTALMVYLLYIYMPTYLNFVHATTLKTEQLSLINVGSLFWYNIIVVLIGMLIDRIDRDSILRWGTISFVLLSFPIYYLLLSHQTVLFTLSFFIFSWGAAMVNVAAPCILLQMFPTEVRVSGVALIYNIAFAIFGGSTPVIATYCINYFHTPYAPAWLLIVVALLTLFSLHRYGRVD